MTAPESWRRTFATSAAAVCHLRERGFSVGRMQANDPRGVMFGEVDIRKWRDLSAGDRLQLHGVLTCGGLTGVNVTIYGSAPVSVHAAIRVGEKEEAL